MPSGDENEVMGIGDRYLFKELSSLRLDTKDKKRLFGVKSLL